VSIKSLSIGDRRYRLSAVERDGQWVATAVREEAEERFGIACTAPSEYEAVERLERWLQWQSEHQAALDNLQHAERAYQRTIAGSAFASPVEGPSPIELQKESLDEVERARRRLDEIRARRPEEG
jgi:hypothetical protein